MGHKGTGFLPTGRIGRLKYRAEERKKGRESGNGNKNCEKGL